MEQYDWTYKSAEGGADPVFKAIDTELGFLETRILDPYPLWVIMQDDYPMDPSGAEWMRTRYTPLNLDTDPILIWWGILDPHVTLYRIWQWMCLVGAGLSPPFSSGSSALIKDELEWYQKFVREMRRRSHLRSVALRKETLRVISDAIGGDMPGAERIFNFLGIKYPTTLEKIEIAFPVSRPSEPALRKAFDSHPINIFARKRVIQFATLKTIRLDEEDQKYQIEMEKNRHYQQALLLARMLTWDIYQFWKKLETKNPTIPKMAPPSAYSVALGPNLTSAPVVEWTKPVGVLLGKNVDALAASAEGSLTDNGDEIILSDNIAPGIEEYNFQI